jgi:hypothetical protein
MKYISVAFLLILMACNPIYVDHNYDLEQDFTVYKSYSWLELDQPTVGDAQSQRRSPLQHKRIVSLIDASLAEKGLTLVESGGDLHVIYHTSGEGAARISSSGRLTSFGNTSVQRWEDGVLMVDLLDASIDQLVWRGTAEGTLSEHPTPEEIEKRTNDAIKKIMDGYPPK